MADPVSNQYKAHRRTLWHVGSIAGTNTITGTVNTAFREYLVGMTISFVAANTNTGATTININGMGAKDLELSLNPLVAGDLVQDQMYVAIYDGTVFQIVSGQGSGSGSSSTRDWATFDSDGAVVVQNENDTLSCTKLSTGTYQVTRDSNFPAGPAAAPLVTPLSIVANDVTIQTTDYPWFATTTPSPANSHLLYDSQTNLLYGTDVDFNTGSGPDRIAYGHLDDIIPNYLTLTGSFDNLGVFKGDSIVIDHDFRLLFVQATDNGGLWTTHIYDLDNLNLLGDTKTLLGGSFQNVIMAHSPTKLLIDQDGTLDIYDRDSVGLPNSSLASLALPGGIGFKHGILDNNDFWWFRDSTSPADWRQLDSASVTTITSNTRDGGTNGMQNRTYAFRPTDNCIYYLTNDLTGVGGVLHLMKISCDSPYTVTQLTASAFSTLNSGTRATTIAGSFTLSFTPDYNHIIVIRGGDVNNYPEFFLLDPSDGSIEVAISLPDPYSNNYGLETIVSLPGVVGTVGNAHLQLIFYGFDDPESALTFEPVVFSARMVDLSSAIVEFWKFANPGKIKTDCGFHIEFAKDP